MQYEKRGYDGLLDRRRGTPSPRAAPFEEVQRVLRLYREKYQGFNGRHFHEIARREHGVKFSYSFVKKALQMAAELDPRDYNFRVSPAFLNAEGKYDIRPKLKCTKCGGKAVGLIYSPDTSPNSYGKAKGG